jgi:Peptidase family S41.
MDESRKSCTAVRRRCAVALLAFIAIAAAFWGYRTWSTRPIDLSQLSVTDWRADLQYAARELPRRHANAFHHISRGAFDQLVTEINDRIGRDTSEDIPTEFLKLTAAIGDGHTAVAVPPPKGRYPLRLYWFGSDLRVISAMAAAEPALGTRLVAINGKSLNEIRALLHQITSEAENQWFFLQVSARLIVRPDVLHALKITEDVNDTRFTFSSDAGGTIEIRLAPAATEGPWKQAYNSAPLFLQHQSDDFWYTYFPDAKTVYVAFNRYDWLLLNSWKLFRYIDAHFVDKLVIDLRNNGGGDYKIGHWCLIRPIRHRPQLNQRGRLFIITGRNTFSAAMSNAAQFRTETNAILIGEPPGEVPNSYQENRSFTLPNSHIAVHYSIAYYKFLPGGGDALVPDENLAPDWQSYHAGLDPVLSKILSH